jgi:hypothetical protein
MVFTNCKVCDEEFEAEDKRTKMCPTCSRQKQLDRCKAYKQKNKERVKEYNKGYKEEHKDEVDAYNRVYNLEHREEIQERQTRTQRERRENDPAFKLSKSLRAKLCDFLKNGRDDIEHTMVDLVGCSDKSFRKWLEYNFTEEMSWENYGTYWHIDHVILCSMFNVLDYDERKTCFNWQNTRPLEALKNLKRKKLSLQDLLNQEIKLYYFKKHIDDFGDHQCYFGTKLVEKLTSGLC